MSKHISRDTSDPEEVRKLEELQELYAEIEREMFAEVLDTYAGRRVLYNIIAKGDIYNQEGETSLDLATSQRQIGRREVAVETLKDALTVDPDVYIVMQREAGEYAEKFKLETGKVTDNG